MILITENQKDKELFVYVYCDGDGTEIDNAYYQNEVRRYSDMGYTVSTVIYPKTETLSGATKKVYEAAYKRKALLDLVNETAMDIMSVSIFNTFQQLTEEYSVEEIVNMFKRSKE